MLDEYWFHSGGRSFVLLKGSAIFRRAGSLVDMEVVSVHDAAALVRQLLASRPHLGVELWEILNPTQTAHSTFGGFQTADGVTLGGLLPSATETYNPAPRFGRLHSSLQSYLILREPTGNVGSQLVVYEPDDADDEPVAAANQASPTAKKSNINSAAQADALVRAANSGAPFCEECEKARQNST